MTAVAVVGGGSWGTALACAARRAGNDVLLWAYEAETVAAINRDHENPAFLPGVALDPAIEATGEVADLARCALLLLVVPSDHLAALARRLDGVWPADLPVCVCTKGLDAASGRVMTEVAGAALRRGDLAALSGPSFAAEVARGLPAAVTVAGPEAVTLAVAETLGHAAFRIYRGSDVVGVQIGGAVKNVIAIACGIAAGLELGLNARAALIARGLAETVRLAESAGGRRETLMGLAGLGDLVLTSTGELSRNHVLGLELGRGAGLAELMVGRGDVVEGTKAAPAVMALARRLGVDMPIVEAVDDVLSGRAAIDAAVDRLLARPVGAEF